MLSFNSKLRYYVTISALVLLAATAAGSWLAIKTYRKLASIDSRLVSVIDNAAFEYQHSYTRKLVIRSHMEQIDSDYVAIVGDSITEALSKQAACGFPLLNAGIGGATISEADRDILPLLRVRAPQALVIAVGVNDARKMSTKPRPQRIRDFEHEYRALLAAAKTMSPRIAVATIGPVEKGRVYGDAVYDSGLIKQFNDIIRSVSKENDILAIDLSIMADAAGFARDGSTIDGVHLSAQGYAGWWSAIEDGLSSVMPDCHPSGAAADL